MLRMYARVMLVYVYLYIQYKSESTYYFNIAVTSSTGYFIQLRSAVLYTFRVISRYKNAKPSAEAGLYRRNRPLA